MVHPIICRFCKPWRNMTGNVSLIRTCTPCIVHGAVWTMSCDKNTKPSSDCFFFSRIHPSRCINHIEERPKWPKTTPRLATTHATPHDTRLTTPTIAHDNEGLPCTATHQEWRGTRHRAKGPRHARRRRSRKPTPTQEPMDQRTANS
jgi:hypothetical protein